MNEWETVGLARVLTVKGGSYCVFRSLLPSNSHLWCLAFNDETLGYSPDPGTAMAEGTRHPTTISQER